MAWPPRSSRLLVACRFPQRKTPPPPLVVHERVPDEPPATILQPHPVATLGRAPLDRLIKFLEARDEPRLPLSRHRLEDRARNREVLRVGQLEPGVDRLAVEVDRRRSGCPVTAGGRATADPPG